MKILGIFVRLYKRDNKDNYLKFLPYTWTSIEKRLQNPALKDLKLLFHKYLSIKKLKKIEIDLVAENRGFTKKELLKMI